MNAYSIVIEILLCHLLLIIEMKFVDRASINAYKYLYERTGKRFLGRR